MDIRVASNFPCTYAATGRDDSIKFVTPYPIIITVKPKRSAELIHIPFGIRFNNLHDESKHQGVSYRCTVQKQVSQSWELFLYGEFFLSWEHATR